LLAKRHRWFELRGLSSTTEDEGSLAMSHWKVIAVAAAFAAVVSVLLGLVAGVVLGAIVARMLLGAGIFAGFAYAAIIVLGKYVPEVLSLGAGSVAAESDALSEAGGDPADPASAPGTTLDITLPEENPHAGGSSADGEPGEPELLESVDDAAAIPETDFVPSSALAAAEPADGVDNMENFEAASTDEASDVEPLESLDGPDSGPPSIRSDGLGDIGSVQGAPEDVGDSAGSSTDSPYGSAQDLASAIRTALSRD
jgi:hypothetical protein